MVSLECLELRQFIKMHLGSWGCWHVTNGIGLQECLVFGRRRSLPWEFLVFFLVFFFLAWYPSASQWGLIDWEFHLQSSSILPPTAPPGFPRHIVLHSGCSSIKHGQDPELSSQEMCAHYQPSYQHQNPVNHSDLRGPLASLVNKGPDVCSGSAHSSFFFFFFWVSFLITRLCMQTLKEH